MNKSILLFAFSISLLLIGCEECKEFQEICEQKNNNCQIYTNENLTITNESLNSCCTLSEDNQTFKCHFETPTCTVTCKRYGTIW